MKFVPIETRYPPEWVHDPSGPNPRIEEVKVPKHLTWAGKLPFSSSLFCATQPSLMIVSVPLSVLYSHGGAGGP